MVSFDRLNELISYNHYTGVLTWKVHRSPKVRSGDVAGSLKSDDGYLTVMVDYHHYYAHRIAWLLGTGEWPNGLIDHNNGNRADNRLCNLRMATRSQQNQNKRVMSNNKSGIKGAWIRCGRWHSAIKVDGVIIDLGFFDTPQEANSAYAEAARQYFGEFARIS